MNVAELIAEINRQLDMEPVFNTVTFSRNDAYSLLSRLTLLRNLIDKGEDKTSAQIAALMVQRADAAERQRNELAEHCEQLEAKIAQLRKELELQKLAKTGLGLTPAPEHE